MLAGTMLLPVDAEAQRGRPRLRERPLTFEVVAGAADFGRFMEDRSAAFIEREVTAATSLTVGGAVGIPLFERTQIRLSATFAPTNFRLVEDDPVRRGDGVVIGNAGEVGVLVFGIEAVRFALDPGRRLVPYGSGGVTATLWSLDERGPIAAFDASQLRFGAAGSIGLQYRFAPNTALRAEVNSFALGNPFDGQDAYELTVAGVKFDEPGSVRMSRLTLGLAFTFFGR